MARFVELSVERGKKGLIQERGPEYERRVN